MENRKKTTAILCACIIGVSILFAALLVRDREMTGSFNGSLDGGIINGGYVGTPSEEAEAVLMDLPELYAYLRLEPSGDDIAQAKPKEEGTTMPSAQTTEYDANGNVVVTTQMDDAQEDDYLAEVRAEELALKRLEKNITSGKWPGFPYVKIGKDYFFNKTAVDNWFAEQGKKQLEIK